MDDMSRRRAIEVRDQHANGGRCDECPARSDKTGARCARFAVWFPVIAELEAQRAGR